MKREHLPEESKPKQREVGEHNIAADDLKFMRSAVEKTYKQFIPDIHPMIMWGLICMICYTSIYFLVKFQLSNWIWAVFLPLMAFGLCYIFITLLLITKREKKAGFISHLKRQLTCVWIIIMVLHGLT
ncbi:MAG: hypothetical protein ACYTEO_07925 [Planctomycetota bacterium]|jgi:hypothetical protein